MADKSQKTEKPTVRHKKEQREKGMVARSPEIGSWLSLLVVAATLPWLGGIAASRVNAFTQQVAQAIADPSTTVALGVLSKGLATFAFAALPIVAVCTVVGTVSAFAQVGLRFTPKAVGFRFSRISPRTGLSRMASAQGFFSLAKTLGKVAVLAAVGYVLLHQLALSVLGGATLPLQTTVAAAGSTVSSLLRDIAGLGLVIAAVDYAFQRRTYQQNMRMTKQEVRDEMRRNDGAPEMRRAVRNKARQLSGMRMMAAVADADVIVTNPTHFAVAVAYDRERDAARVVAKGADHVALRIRERGEAAGVPIVENPVLARTLHSSCEIDDLVPPVLYAAVAQLLAFVYSLTPAAKLLGAVHRMDSPSLRMAG